MCENQCPVCKSTNVELTPLIGILIPKVKIRCLEHSCGAIFEKDVDSTKQEA
jgi:hypothetical protein